MHRHKLVLTKMVLSFVSTLWIADNTANWLRFFDSLNV